MTDDKPILPDFDEVANLLAQANAVIGLAEAHGMLTGYVCAGQQVDGHNWLETILGVSEVNNPISRQLFDTFIQLYNTTSLQLEDTDCAFKLLLPSDHEKISKRLLAVREWLQGFLSSLGLANVEIEVEEDSEIEELLEDFVEITRMDCRVTGATQDDEIAYDNLAEYVRMGIIMLYDQLRSQQEDEEGSVSERTLH
jgi:yecA family protein